jgi:hypothetical protein
VKFARHTLLVLLLGLIAASYTFADYYRYRDKNGVLRFTDDLSEVPADQRPKLKHYKETQPAPQAKEKASRTSGKKGGKQTARKPKNRNQTAAQWLIREKGELDKLYKELLNDKMTLANQSQHIQTPEDAKKYRRDLKRLNERIEKFEKRRYKYQNRASVLKDQIEKEQKRQNRPTKTGVAQ